MASCACARMPCCPEGCHGPAAPTAGYLNKGRFEDVCGLSCYFVGQGEHAIVVGHDAFGAGSGRTLQICDDLAEALGVIVVLPELFGQGAGISKGGDDVVFLTDPFRKAEPFHRLPGLYWRALTRLPGFLGDMKSQGWEKLGPLVLDKVMPMLRQRGAKRVAALGICWGGWLVTHLCASEDFCCGVTFHPSQTEVCKMLGEDLKELSDKVQCPQMLLAAKEDSAAVKEGGLVHEAYLAKPFGEECILRTFGTMRHGWTNRGPLDDPDIAREAAAALDAAKGFFRRHLLQPEAN